MNTIFERYVSGKYETKKWVYSYLRSMNIIDASMVAYLKG